MLHIYCIYCSCYFFMSIDLSIPSIGWSLLFSSKSFNRSFIQSIASNHQSIGPCMFSQFFWPKLHTIDWSKFFSFKNQFFKLCQSIGLFMSIDWSLKFVGMHMNPFTTDCIDTITLLLSFSYLIVFVLLYYYFYSHLFHLLIWILLYVFSSLVSCESYYLVLLFIINLIFYLILLLNGQITLTPHNSFYTTPW